MSAPPTAPDYSYDQDPPPRYESLQKNAGPQMSYGAVPGAIPTRPYPTQPYPIAQPGPPAQVIIVGGCPACRVGVLEDDFTALGVLCAVLFFPLGILCCLALKQRRCSNCGAIFG